MKQIYLLGLLMVYVIVSEAYNPMNPKQTVQKVPFTFLENKGQIVDQYNNPRPDIDFRIAANGVNTFIGSGQIHYQWAQPMDTIKPKINNRLNRSFLDPQSLPLTPSLNPKSSSLNMYRMDVTLLGANKNARLIKENKQDYYERYYLPQCGPDGATAYGYEKLTYKNIYPNIDWVIYIKGEHVEYDFVVHPGGKVSDIQLQYRGATSIKLDSAGGIVAVTPLGSVTEQAPLSFQEDGAAVNSHFILNDDVLSFAVEQYEGTLTIDPVLVWGTYYGDAFTFSDGICDVEYYKLNGNGVYACGMTENATNIATTGAYQMNLWPGNDDAFLVKFNSAGIRKWGTYFGGPGVDGQGSRISCDTLGNIYMTGMTTSATNIATPGSFKDTISGPASIFPFTNISLDVFLVKFDSSGERLWATYYGGKESEVYSDVTTDGLSVYLVGETQSPSGIATLGSHQEMRGNILYGNTSGALSNDAFLVKFDSSGERQWATYYGGESPEIGGLPSVVCDKLGFVYIAYSTMSDSGIATSGSHQEFRGSSLTLDAFIAKFNSEGVRQWGTFYGGEGDEFAYSITCDDSCNIYIAGLTNSDTGIAMGTSHQNNFAGGRDVFIAKFDSTGHQQWGTYYGGPSWETGVGAICYASGRLFLCGSTASTTGIATPGAYQSTNDATRVAIGTGFLAEFNSTWGIRNWATYYGGTVADQPWAIAYDPHGFLYVGGAALSDSGIATPGSHQATATIGGPFDIYISFLSKFCISPNFSAYDVQISGVDTLCANGTETYSIPAIEDATSYIWTLPSGWTGSSDSNSIDVTYDTTGGLIGVRFVRCDDTSDVKTYEVYVTPLVPPVITIDDFVLGTLTPYSSYQWFLNDAPIPGATNRQYTIMTNGDYKVVTSNRFGCMDTSEVYTVSNYTSIEDINTLKQNIKIYPNPGIDLVYIEAPITVSIIVSDMEGRTLIEENKTQSIDIGDLASGIYMIKVLSIEGRVLKIEQLVKVQQ